MNIHKSHSLLLVSLLGALALAACSKPAPPPAPAAPPAAAPAPAPAAAPAAPAPVTTLASVQLGNALDANGKVTAAATTFAPHDTIYAEVVTNTTGGLTSTITANWTYQGGVNVNSSEQQITANGAATTTFHIAKPSGFPAGAYTLQVSIDGKVANTTSFEVK